MEQNNKNNFFSRFSLISKYKIDEIILLFVLSSIIGFVFFLWTYAYDFLSVFLKPLGLSGLNVGIWMIGGILPAFIIRKPGAALIGEVIAAFIEGWITKWGISAVIWGFVQGVGAELVFAIFLYKKWNLLTSIIAGLISCIFSFFLDFFYSKYYTLTIKFNLLQLFSYCLSGIVEAGIISYILFELLRKSGIINKYLERNKNL
ncbi:MAG: ECF transporter S component [Spirochaetes bacterium]|nr:ECF transporter S component [Spirochaetota bacterium]